MRQSVDGAAAIFLDLDVTLFCPSALHALLSCLGPAEGASSRDLCFMHEPEVPLLNTGVIAWRASSAVRQFFQDAVWLLRDRIASPYSYGAWPDLAPGDPPADGQIINHLLPALNGT